MSIALERNNRIGGSGFIRGISCIPIYESPEIGAILPEGRRCNPPATAEREVESSSCSSSSIGRNSDCSGRSTGSDGEDSGEKEVQSRFKGPLETMDALEESLPIRRGISKFYCGKSKSFTSLADVASYSTEDLAKPENAYNRKRKNLLAFSSTWERPHNNPLKNSEGGVSKRPANSNRSIAALSSSGSNSNNSNSGEEEHEPSRLLPPLHPQGKPTILATKSQKLSFPVRSFSLTDLQGATSSGCSVRPGDKQKRFY